MISVCLLRCSDRLILISLVADYVHGRDWNEIFDEEFGPMHPLSSLATIELVSSAAVQVSSGKTALVLTVDRELVVASTKQEPKSASRIEVSVAEEGCSSAETVSDPVSQCHKPSKKKHKRGRRNKETVQRKQALKNARKQSQVRV